MQEIMEQFNFQGLFLTTILLTIIRMKDTMKVERANRVVAYQKVLSPAQASGLAEKKYSIEKLKGKCILWLLTFLSLSTFVLHLQNYFNCVG